MLCCTIGVQIVAIILLSYCYCSNESLKLFHMVYRNNGSPHLPVETYWSDIGLVKNKMTECFEKWHQELIAINDFDKEYILNGVKNGFDILDGNLPQFSFFTKNYISTTGESSCKVSDIILNEVQQGNYVECTVCPQIVSGLGAVPKSEPGKIRLIHDMRKSGLNAMVHDTSVHYTTVDEATKTMKHNAYLCKIDLSSAYRSVPIHPSGYKYTGLSWCFSHSDKRHFFFDTKLSFGAAKSCQIFSRLTSSVCRMMARRGFNVFSYLDDFLVITDSKSECWLAFNELINLLSELGFTINWNKVSPPCQQLVYLGVHINTVSRTLSLPQHKVFELIDLLNHWLRKKRASRKDIQSICGKLNWACRVIRGGRHFLRNLLNLIKKLKNDKHRIWINREARSDLRWWSIGLQVFNGDTPFVDDIPDPAVFMNTDACETGCAGICGDDWFYANFNIDFPEIFQRHISDKELFAILLSVRRWSKHWAKKHILVYCDNMPVVKALNKGSSTSSFFMACIQEIFWFSVKYDFIISACHVPGKYNFTSDAFSRLDSSKHFVVASNIIYKNIGVIYGEGHMSYMCFRYLQELHLHSRM